MINEFFIKQIIILAEKNWELEHDLCFEFIQKCLKSIDMQNVQNQN